MLWAPFWVFWGSNGWLWGSLEPPLAAQGAQSEIYPICSVPFGSHVRSILEVQNAPKSDESFDGFVSGVFMVLGWVLGPVLRIFSSCLGTFCDMAKTRKIARRVGESTKIEGWGDHKWRPNQKKNTSKTDPKNEAGNHPKMDLKVIRNGAQIGLKRHLKINVFLARFLDPSGNIDGTSRELRVSHFLQPTPQGGAILSKITVQ